MNTIIFITITILLIYLINNSLSRKGNFIIEIDFKQAYLNNLKPEKIRKTYLDKHGYRRFKDSSILVSRYIIEKELKRKLNKEEVVHHKDGNKLNNNINNLRLFKNQTEHHNHHLKNMMHTNYWYEKKAPYFLNKNAYINSIN